jgi:uncharacterized damage-inducible protein DinB
MPQEPGPIPSQPAAVDRAAIRAELEQTRERFHALLESVPDDRWDLQSGNRAWTVGQLLWHIAAGVGLTAGSVAMAKQGRGHNPPRWLANRINSFTTKRGARNADKEEVAQTYDEGHANLLAALDALGDDEWDKGSRIFGRYTTVEGHFRSVAEHFDEHRVDIERA